MFNFCTVEGMLQGEFLEKIWEWGRKVFVEISGMGLRAPSFPPISSPTPSPLRGYGMGLRVVHGACVIDAA